MLDLTTDRLSALPQAEKVELLALLERKLWLDERRKCRTDLFFLLTEVLNRPDIDRPWLRERCNEVQAEPNGMLDLWAREHYKSTLITFGLTIQDILASHGDEPLLSWGGREATIGIFSHTRPNAKGFLRQIKQEFETNRRLQALFPDILWPDPRKSSPKWSEDDGIVVKRKGNPKEATVEAWGIVDGQPTGKHFLRLVYDDLVTKESVSTPEMIQKTTDALSLSYNLGAEGGAVRFIGTRYHYNDSYKAVLDRGTAKPRIYPATDDGSATGTPVLLSQELLTKKRQDMGPYVFACQMLQDPKADETQGFREEWLKYYDKQPTNTTNYILVDAANGKRASNDYTAAWVVGLGSDKNYYVLDIVRDRLNLTQRAKMLMDLHRRWQPHEVRYEKYGMMADIEHIKYVQEHESYRFNIVEVAGQTSKPDRIKRLIPLFEQGRVYFPRSLYKTNYEGTVEDLVQVFIHQEYKPFPVSLHDDMGDSLARIEEPDMPLSWPMPTNAGINYATYFADQGFS
jgi:predicted phage terminase large subunit-like protein